MSTAASARHLCRPMHMAWATLLGLMAWGCQTAVPHEGEDFQVRTEPVPPLNPLTGEAPTSDPVRWAIRTVALPLAQPTADAWALIDERVLPDLSRSVWNANGLRIGLLSAADAQAFGEALGSVAFQRNSQVLSYQHPTPIRDSPPLAAEFYADLTIPPATIRKEYLTRGELRLLISSRPLGNNAARIELIPQHYVREISITPRNPLDKILDGRVFEELGIHVNVGFDQALVIGYFRPPDATPPPPAGPEEEADAPSRAAALPQDPSDSLTAEDTMEEPTQPQPPAVEPHEVFDNAASAGLPLDLGRGLFTLGRARSDLQILMLLRPVPLGR